MKTMTLLLLSLAIGFAMEAAGQINQLTLWEKDGTKVDYYLNGNPKITFTDTHAVISSNGVEVNYPLQEIERITYGENAMTALNDIEGGVGDFNFDGNTLLFHEIEAGTVVSVYSLNGALLLKDAVGKTGRYALELSGIPTGIYLVNINGATYKIIKK